MRILQVNSHDIAGGASKIAWDLLAQYQARDYPAWLAVHYRFSDNPAVLQIPPTPPRPFLWTKLRYHLRRLMGNLPGLRAVCDLLYQLPADNVELQKTNGREYFNYPGSRQLLKLPPKPPQIVHAHNLHGDYFDLRFLPELSQRTPTLLTLHDAWLLSGHCSHSFGCQRWQSGCGGCPRLDIYPAVVRDATAANWQFKRDL